MSPVKVIRPSGRLFIIEYNETSYMARDGVMASRERGREREGGNVVVNVE